MMRFNRFETNEHRSILSKVQKHMKNGTRPKMVPVKRESISKEKYPECGCSEPKYNLTSRQNKSGSYMIRVKCNGCHEVGNQSIKWSLLPEEAVIRAILKSRVKGPVSTIRKRNEWK